MYILTCHLSIQSSMLLYLLSSCCFFPLFLTITPLFAFFISLHNKYIGDTVATALAESLKTNTIVTDIKYVALFAVVLLFLLLFLDHHPLLAFFSLTYNHIGDTGATALAEALKTNTTVTTIEYVALFAVVLLFFPLFLTITPLLAFFSLSSNEIACIM